MQLSFKSFLFTAMDDWFNWIEEVKFFRKDQRIGPQILFFPETDSTHLQARNLARQGEEEGLLIIADSQTGGKGRRGRSWHSPPGMNLYASLVLRPALAPGQAPQITLLAGVAAAKAVRKVTGLEARLKWPNDVYVHGKKVAGILSEMEAQGERVRFVVVSIGVNINGGPMDFPPDLRKVATSLRIETGKTFSRAQVAAEICAEMEENYFRLLAEGFFPGLRDEWNRLSWVNQKEGTVKMSDQEFFGFILGLDAEGALLLRDPEGKTRRFITGDVSLRL